MISLSPQATQDNVLNDLVPDLTPMLDVLFILLVFFMLSTGVVLRALDVQLPRAIPDAPPLKADTQAVVLELHHNGYSLHGQRLDTLADVQAAIVSLMAATPNQDIMIAGEKHIPMERLVHILTFLQSQNITSANILMQGLQEAIP